VVEEAVAAPFLEVVAVLEDTLRQHLAEVVTVVEAFQVVHHQQTPVETQEAVAAVEEEAVHRVVVASNNRHQVENYYTHALRLVQRQHDRHNPWLVRVSSLAPMPGLDLQLVLKTQTAFPVLCQQNSARRLHQAFDDPWCT
jgi:hypothetical protein